MEEYILETLIAIPILGIELYFFFIWFVKFYLVEKRITLDRFKRRIKDFYQYRKKIRHGILIPSETMKHFLDTNKNTMLSAGINFIFLSICFYVVGLVMAIIFVSIAHVFGGVYPWYILLFSYILVVFIGIGCFYKLWCSFVNSVIAELDRMNSFLLGFTKLLRKENI